jgi:SAM-dependent methyltransferase
MEKIKKPWPTKKAMEQVYEKKLWGKGSTEFYSGEGSHLPDLVHPYLKRVISFLTSFDKKLIVCDLGCGDFNIGKELAPFTQKYEAIDIATNLIEFNRKQFRLENLDFHCLDISEEELPHGDCAIVRQVLQHLSNAEIQKIVQKLQDFKYVILTEHLPQGDFIANIDIISGQGIRIKKKSGIDLLKAPFYFKVNDCKDLVTMYLEGQKGVLVTTLYTM